MKRIIVIVLLAILGNLPAQSAGEYIWQLGFGGPALGDDVQIYATTTDTSGNVYMVGNFKTTTPGGISFGGANLSSGTYAILVAKYNSSGIHQWSLALTSTTSGATAFGVRTDNSGNVYVCGSFNGTVDFDPGAGVHNLASAGSTDIYVLKLDSSGNYVWAIRFGGFAAEVANSIAVMSDGTFAITGQFTSVMSFGGGTITPVGNNDIFIAKYDSSGNYIWALSVGGTSGDTGTGVAIDAAGEVAITGYFKNTITLKCASLSTPGTGENGLILKYSTTGILLWARRFGGNTGARGAAIAMDYTSGEVVATGFFSDTVNFGGIDRVNTNGPDLFIAKYSTGGTWIWDFAYGGVATISPFSTSIALDSSGNISITGGYVTGAYVGCVTQLVENGTQNVFLAKYDSNGTCLWSQYFGASSFDEVGRGVIFDPTGKIIIAGDFVFGIDFGGGNMSSPGGDSGFLAKFNP